MVNLFWGQKHSVTSKMSIYLTAYAQSDALKHLHQFWTLLTLILCIINFFLLINLPYLGCNLVISGFHLFHLCAVELSAQMINLMQMSFVIYCAEKPSVVWHLRLEVDKITIGTAEDI